MLRALFIPRAVTTLRFFASRNNGGWTPRPQPELPAPTGAKTAAFTQAERVEKTEARKPRVICQNWQRFGSCRYGERCAFAEGHVDRASAAPRSIRHRSASCERFPAAAQQCLRALGRQFAAVALMLRCALILFHDAGYHPKKTPRIFTKAATRTLLVFAALFPPPLLMQRVSRALYPQTRWSSPFAAHVLQLFSLLPTGQHFSNPSQATSPCAPPPHPTFTTNRPPFLRSSAVAVPPHDRHLREILSQARRSFRSPLSAHICPRGAHTTCSQAQHVQASLARGYSRRRSIHDSQRSPAAATAARAGRRRAAAASHVSNGRRHGRARTALTRRQCRYPHARGRSFHSARQAVQSKSDRSLLILNKMNPTVANHAPAATQPTKEEKKHHRTLCPKHQHCTCSAHPTASTGAPSRLPAHSLDCCVCIQRQRRPPAPAAASL
jgi:hypothetical protein